MGIGAIMASVMLVFAGLAALVWGSGNFTTVSASFMASFAIGAGVLYIAIAGVFLTKELREQRREIEQ